MDTYMCKHACLYCALAVLLSISGLAVYTRPALTFGDLCHCDLWAKGNLDFHALGNETESDLSRCHFMPLHGLRQMDPQDGVSIIQ